MNPLFRRISLSLAIFSLLTPLVAFAATESPAAQHSALSAQLQQRAEQFFQGNQAGGVVLVRKGDEVVLRQGFGFADVENQVPMTPDHVLRLASVSKQFTAFAILQLVQSGKLRLVQPLAEVLPTLPPALGKVTLQQLLSHSSGVRNISTIQASRDARRNDANIDTLIAFFKDLPLDFEPGSRFNYSNSNYILLTKVIETVTGQAYAEHMQQAVFSPLGMKHTRYDSHTALVTGRAHGYRMVDGSLQNADFISMSQPQGAGALMSTADDMNTWDLALYQGQRVKPALLEQAFRKVKLSDGSEMPYGFGWMLSQVQGQTSNEHSGFINGFSSYTLRVPSQRIYVTVLSNSEQFWPDDFAVELAALALGQAFDKTPAKTGAATPWLGRYTFGKDDVRELKQEQGKLQLLQEGNDPSEVIATADGRFYLGEGLNYLTFEQRHDGKLAMTMHDRLMGDSVGLK